MALNFDALSDSPEFETEKPSTSGIPLQLLLSDITEDPEKNPRFEFDNKQLNDLAANILVNNVKSPVSVRANPTGEPPWILNYGARRFRASKIANKETIPAFVDEQFSDYDAVAENAQRQNLSALELAMFIQKRIEQGETNKDIAEQLHKDKQTITHHLALLDMPDDIATAYRDKRVTSARAIYDLVNLNKKYEHSVTKFLKKSEFITAGSVRDLAKKMKSSDAQATSDKSQKTKATKKTVRDNELDIAKFADIPVLRVVVGNKSAVIVLERKPTATGMVWVKYLQGGEVAEVQAKACSLVELTSADELEKLDVDTA